MADNLYSITRVGNNVNSSNMREFIIKDDSAETIAALPRKGIKGNLDPDVGDTLPCDIGSTAFCPSSGSLYMLGTENQWIKVGGGGGSSSVGGGGVSDYTMLSNLPKINGVTLKGDLSSEDLGIIMITGEPDKVETVTNILNKVSINQEGNLTFNGQTVITNDADKVEYCSDDDIDNMFE